MRLYAALLTCVLYLQLGWVVILAPALVLRLETAFGQSDASFGLLYFAWWSSYAIGALAGGWVTERIGRRPVLVLSFLVGGALLLAQGVTADWWIFLLLGIPRSFGSGAVDAGGTALMLDLYPDGRGRALNAAHLFFAVGATAAPFVVGALDGAGVAWQTLMTGSGVALLPASAASPFGCPCWRLRWRLPATSAPRWVCPAGWSESSPTRPSWWRQARWVSSGAA